LDSVVEIGEAGSVIFENCILKNVSFITHRACELTFDNTVLENCRFDRLDVDEQEPVPEPTLY